MHHLWGYLSLARSLSLAISLMLGLLTAPIAAASEIGLQFLVERDTAENTGKVEIERMVGELNATFTRSEVALTAHVMRVAVLDLDTNDALRLLEQMQAGSGPFVELHIMADVVGADFTIVLNDALMLRGKANCGRAFDVNQTLEELTDPSRAVAVMRPRCGSHTLAHELGHLMGLNHGSLVDTCAPGRGHTSAIAPYANGYAVGNCDGDPQPGEFGTVMVGGWMQSINGERLNRLEVFSNPEVLNDACGSKRRCGDRTFGNAARALNEHASLYASHHTPDADRLDYADPALHACIKRDFTGIEVDALIKFRCKDPGLASLAGIEQLHALREIDVGGATGLPCSELSRAASLGLRVVAPAHCQND